MNQVTCLAGGLVQRRINRNLGLPKQRPATATPDSGDNSPDPARSFLLCINAVSHFIPSFRPRLFVHDFVRHYRPLSQTHDRNHSPGSSHHPPPVRPHRPVHPIPPLSTFAVAPLAATYIPSLLICRRDRDDGELARWKSATRSLPLCCQSTVSGPASWLFDEFGFLAQSAHADAN